MNKKLHVIGLCGKGTSAVAHMMKQQGWEISGSDTGIYEPIASYLKEKKIFCHEGFSEKNIPTDVDMVLMGSSAVLDPKTNPEVAKAYQMNVPIKSFAEILGDLTQNTDNIVITGSYGKSTTTSMITHILRELELDPNYFIGAIPLGFDSASHLSDSSYFVLEGDEYPYKIDDLKSKFLFYNTKSLLLTSAEHDHINKFPTQEDYLKPYRELLDSMTEEDLVIAAIEHPFVKELTEITNPKVISYGLEEGDYQARNIEYGETSSFDVFKHGEFIARFEIAQLGKHNIENMLGSITLILEKKIAKAQELQKHTKSFKGIKRRLDKKSELSKIPIYEGYGSSYTKAKTAIDAMNLHFPNKELLVIFEPHTFGWRNKGNLNWYRNIFKGADAVCIYKPPVHGAKSHEQLNLEEIVHEAKKSCSKIYKMEDKDTALHIATKHIHKNTAILLLTSGDLGGLIQKIPKWCEEKLPN